MDSILGYIPIELCLIIIFIHWVSDFICQTHEMSIKKSKSNLWLTKHVMVYTAVTTILWGITFAFESGFEKGLILAGITFITHWITDYFTSRWTSKLYAKGDIHNFFVVVGLDQFIHYTTLLGTYSFLYL
jgi:hypothetical protein